MQSADPPPTCLSPEGGARRRPPQGLVASGSGDKSVRVWDLETGSVSQLLAGHTDGVTALAQLPQGRIVSGAMDGRIMVRFPRGSPAPGAACPRTHDHAIPPQVWRLAEDDEAGDGGACEQQLGGDAGGSGYVRALAAVDALRFVSGADDGALRVWRWRDGVCEATVAAHEGYIFGAAALEPGLLAVAAADGTLSLWRQPSAKRPADLGLERRLSGHRCAVCSVAAVSAAAPGWLASGSSNGTIRVWDAADGTCEVVLAGHSEAVWGICAVLE